MRHTNRWLLDKMYKELFIHRIKGDKSFADICLRVQKRNANWNCIIIDKCDTFPTIVSSSHYYTWDICGKIADNEYCQVGTYPLDYNFKDIEPKYLIGMSVPPVMTAQIANQIKIQWLDKIN
jgi:DNA (cytosine-5)-methyltransferase 1